MRIIDLSSLPPAPRPHAPRFTWLTKPTSVKERAVVPHEASAPSVVVPDQAFGGVRGDIDTLRTFGALDAVTLGTWDYDLRTRLVSWDEHTASLFGMHLSEFDGRLATVQRLVHPDDREATERAFVDAVVLGKAVDCHYRVVWPDGTIRHLLTRGKSVPDPEGRTRRLLGGCVDVTEVHSSVSELERAVLAQSEAAGRLAGIAETALQLTAADTPDELVRIVLDRGAKVLGADGGAVCVRNDDRGTVTLSISESLGEQTAIDYAELPLDNELPAIVAARTGQTVLLPDRAAGLRFTPLMAEVFVTTGRIAWAMLPMQVAGRPLGSLAVSWVEERTFSETDVELLHAFAAQCALALDRITHLQIERRRAAAARSLSERLQRSLLTRPPEVDGVQLAVRYSPAAEGARIGGDWYDALRARDGSLVLAVGDCAGHDQAAAAAMASVRNLLRSTAYLLGKPPAAVLTALEDTMAGLAVDALATAVVAVLDEPDALSGTGSRRFTWSNAGHLPPLVRMADGTTRVLMTTPDLLLGLMPGTHRADHSVTLEPGSTVLFYTDGLTERRDEDLDIGIERLRALVTRLGHLPLDELCEALLEQAPPPEGAEDDIALLALRLDDL